MNIRKVFSSSIVNLAYQLLPATCAIVMVPLTINWFGSELFSAFSLAISIIILFNYLNFGVAQSANRELSKEYSGNNKGQISKVVTSSFIGMLILGLSLSIIGMTLSDIITQSLISKNSEIYTEVKVMIQAVLVASPLFLLVILCRSILESKLLFKYTSFNRALLNTFIFLSPAFCYFLSLDLRYSIYFIIAVHGVSFITLLFIVISEFEGIKIAISRETFLKLFVTGGWLTLISLSSVGFLYADKFIIGSALGLTSLAFYVAAYDLISRASILYGSITAAFFPAFSYWIKVNDLDSLRESVKYLVLIMTIVMGLVLSIVIIFSEDILSLWINDDFSSQSSMVLRVLCLGVFFSSLSIIYMRLLCAADFEKVLSVFYIILAFIYVVLSYFVAGKYGIVGIAWLFSVRCIFEFVVLLCLSKRHLSNFILVSNKAWLVIFINVCFIVYPLLFTGLTLLLKMFYALLVISTFFVVIFLERANFKAALSNRTY